MQCNGVILDPQNQRVKVMNVQTSNLDGGYIHHLQAIEKETGFTKTIIYSKKGDVDFFLNHGFHQEGKIDGFFNGQNAYILAKFQSQERAESKLKKEEDEIITLAKQNANRAERKSLPETMNIRMAQSSDANQLSELFQVVFKTYPTPVHEPDYIKQVMSEDTTFMVVEVENQIVSVASAEVSSDLGSVEMTDCATHPDFRGHGLLSYLFFALEEVMEKMGIYFLYSLTRAQSPAMNITASKHGYQYRGRLVNNCDIFSGYEDMNIWVKPLKPTRD